MKNFSILKILVIFLAIFTTILSLFVLHSISKQCNCQVNAPKNINASFVPVGNPGGSWPSPDDEKKCLQAFSQVDPTCQENPNSDKIACSDFPFFYCDGQLRASGDLDQSNCSYGSAIAYNSNECSNPRTLLLNGAYLCGGNLDPCVEKEKTGMNCKVPAPENPWNATNICYPS